MSQEGKDALSLRRICMMGDPHRGLQIPAIKANHCSQFTETHFWCSDPKLHHLQMPSDLHENRDAPLPGASVFIVIHSYHLQVNDCSLILYSLRKVAL